MGTTIGSQTITSLDYWTTAEEKPTHASILNIRDEFAKPQSSPRKISPAEAIRLANANFERVEGLLKREMEHDALGTAVWEEE